MHFYNALIHYGLSAVVTALSELFDNVALILSTKVITMCTA